MTGETIAFWCVIAAMVIVVLVVCLLLRALSRGGWRGIDDPMNNIENNIW